MLFLFGELGLIFDSSVKAPTHTGSVVSLDILPRRQIKPVRENGSPPMRYTSSQIKTWNPPNNPPNILPHISQSIAY